ncbi:hypothetical protein ACFWMS_14600 [Peribacillus butanolivorans]|uniref:hypothetical protein n=1 Tax=Peribacillus butanolivorans TaxID=421767 RepID=UPI00365627E6
MTILKTSRFPIYSRPFRNGEHPIPSTQAYQQLNKAAEFTCVEHAGNHTLRKTFGYSFYKATKDVNAATDPAAFPSFCHTLLYWGY